MGCGVSRLDGNGMVLPAKLRPIFLYRLEVIKMRRHARPLKSSDSTPSKKELLLHDHDRDEDDKSSSSDQNVPKMCPKEKVSNPYEEKPGKPIEEANHHKNEENENTKIESVKVKAEDEDAETDGSDCKEDEDDHDRRRIRRNDDDDDGDFPGSPSFRVYFKDGEGKLHDDITGD